MKKQVSILVVLALLVTSIVPAYASTTPPQQEVPQYYFVLPQDEKLDDSELAEIKGEVAPWVVGAVVGGITDVALKVADNYLNGERGMDLLDGCGRELITGAVAGALTAPVKTVMATAGIFTTAKKVYDTSKIAVNIGSGVASYAAGKVYDSLTDN